MQITDPGHLIIWYFLSSSRSQLLLCGLAIFLKVVASISELEQPDARMNSNRTGCIHCPRLQVGSHGNCLALWHRSTDNPPQTAWIWIGLNCIQKVEGHCTDRIAYFRLCAVLYSPSLFFGRCWCFVRMTLWTWTHGIILIHQLKDHTWILRSTKFRSIGSSPWRRALFHTQREESNHGKWWHKVKLERHHSSQRSFVSQNDSSYRLLLFFCFGISGNEVARLRKQDLPKYILTTLLLIIWEVLIITTACCVRL